MTDIRMDWGREARTGVSEAVLCSSKTPGQIADILRLAARGDRRLLLTRLDPAVHETLAADELPPLDYDPMSRTAFLGPRHQGEPRDGIAIVAAGTSDVPIAREAARTLEFHGYAAPMLVDVGVAGLWRLLDRVEELRRHRVLIAVAGMEGALFSVLAGLVEAPVIAVPAPGGYGVDDGGTVALNAALASCSPGITAVNIGNGFGAASTAIRILRTAAAATSRDAEAAEVTPR